MKPKLRARGGAEEIVNKEEARSLKSVLGAALWLARESRPDLSVQVSRGQQLLPNLTSKMHEQLEISQGKPNNTGL